MNPNKQIYISFLIWVLLVIGWYLLIVFYPYPSGDAAVGAAIGVGFIPLPFVFFATICPVIIGFSNWGKINRISLLVGFAPSIIALSFIIFGAIKLFF